MLIIKSIVKIILSFFRKLNGLRSKMQKIILGKCGTNVYIGHNCDFICKNIFIGNNVFIGNHASFISANSKIIIGNYVMFGPHVTIRGGNHRIDVIGEYMYNVKEKLPENDQNVIIQDDVWVGCNVTILKGVTIGRGAVVAAAAVVTKDVPPYSIVGGNPAKIIKLRFNENQIIEHEKLLLQKNENQK